MWTVPQKVLIWLAALGTACLGALWLYVFVLTDHRSHHRPIMIPMALLVLLFAVVLARLKIWAVLLLLIGLSAAGAFAAWLQISGWFLHPFLASCVVVAVAYLALLSPPVIRALTTRSRGMPMSPPKPGSIGAP